MIYTEIELYKIKKFFSKDILNFKEYPIEQIRTYFDKPQKRNYIFDTTIIKNESIRKEYKTFLYSIFVNEKPYSYKSRSIIYIYHLPEFLNTIKTNSIFDTDEKYQTEMMMEYFKSINKKDVHSIISLYRSMLFWVAETMDPRKGLNRDYWILSTLKINKERINKSMACMSINFRTINNKNNRNLAKTYFKYLLGGTELAVSFIQNKFTHINCFAKFLGDKSFLDVTEEDVIEFSKTIKDKYATDTFNRYLFNIKDFYMYLGAKKIYTNPNPVFDNIFLPNKKSHHYNNVSQFTLMQIFNHLHLMEFSYRTMFLISYCTGLRLSDICQLKTNCLHQTNSYYFIRFSIQKMQKEHSILIPNALADYISKQKEIVNNESEYLFPSLSDKTRPFNENVYLKEIKKYMNTWKITNDDGTPYDYKSHSYRHLIASELYMEGVPIEIIQLAVLGHQQINMTQSYIDIDNNYKKMVEDTYINKVGEKNTLFNYQTQKDITEDNLRKHLLPNGICGYPEKLGLCPNIDACLSCEHFRTSKKYLKVHETELANLNTRIPIYRENNWFPQLEQSLKHKEILEKIIASLKSL